MTYFQSGVSLPKCIRVNDFANQFGLVSPKQRIANSWTIDSDFTLQEARAQVKQECASTTGCVLGTCFFGSCSNNCGGMPCYLK